MKRRCVSYEMCSGGDRSEVKGELAMECVRVRDC